MCTLSVECGLFTAPPPGLCLPPADFVGPPPGLALVVASLPGFTHLNDIAPPPGLLPPPGLHPPPGLPQPGASAQVAAKVDAPFNLRVFRRQLNDILKELRVRLQTVDALRQLDDFQVPLKFQSNEFTNILTRITEERTHTSRRVMFAFAASLAGKHFRHDLCISGLESFFDDVYEDLCEEESRLPQIVKNEMIPSMSAFISADDLDRMLPASLKQQSA